LNIPIHNHHPHLHPHSFPTRRSSDLDEYKRFSHLISQYPSILVSLVLAVRSIHSRWSVGMTRNFTFQVDFKNLKLIMRIKRRMRSEEHTSELQSRFDLVCRLLLEKKK